MSVNAFNKFESSLNEKYREFEDFYPILNQVLQLFIRLSHANRNELLEAKIKEINNGFLINFLFLCCRGVLRFLGLLNFSLRQAVFVKLGNFNHLSKVVCEKFTSYRVLQVDREKGAWKFPLCKIFDLSSLQLRGFYLTELKLVANDILNDNIHSSHFHHRCNRLERKLEGELALAVNLLRLFNVKYLFLNGDFEIRDRLLVLAARKSDIPVVIVQHGYIQDKLLVSVFPMISSIYLLWDQSQVNLVERSGADRKILYNFGLPTNEIIKSVKSKWNLFVCEPMFQLDCVSSFVEMIEQIALESSLPLLIRFHPMDIANKNFEVVLNSLNNNFLVSKGYIRDDFKYSNIILGTNSSVLITSHLNGFQTFQIKEFKKFSFPNVPVIELKNALKLVSIDNSADIKALDIKSLEKRFSDFLYKNGKIDFEL